jgi:uncharacterized membrane protein YqgA involved in biofilm formation
LAADIACGAELYGGRRTKGKLFFVSFVRAARQNGPVIGAFLNALGILLGSLLGLVRRQPVSARVQAQFKSALGVLTAFCGLHLLWLNVGGSAGAVLKQLFLAGLALVLGNLLGRLLALQKISNHLGRRAAGLLAGAGAKPADGFVAVTILFCAAPLGLVGAVTDGLGNYFFPLALKAVMDGLAMTSFVKMFRWPVALAAAPVFLFLNGLAVIVHALVLPKLATPELVHAINAAAGLLICSMTLVILEVRRVELANYLPALFLAPILSRFLA